MPHILIETFSFVAYLLFGYMTFWFFVALFLKRNDVADIAWGLGFILVAISIFGMGGVWFDRGFVVTALVTIWGLRLAFHIFKRNIHKPEDKRYAVWRESWGKWFVVRSYFQVFILQGILLFLIVSPVVLVTLFRGNIWTVWDVLGIGVWLVGFYFEGVGDRQLRNFLKNPDNKGKILNTGLWKYTRHPNYFGEVTQWWGIWIIALSVPFGVWTIVGPLTITFLILKVSCVTMNIAEQQVPSFRYHLR
jgi:steroid 5-alpha reductase family enzyme